MTSTTIPVRRIARSTAVPTPRDGGIDNWPVRRDTIPVAASARIRKQREHNEHLHHRHCPSFPRQVRCDWRQSSAPRRPPPPIPSPIPPYLNGSEEIPDESSVCPSESTARFLGLPDGAQGIPDSAKRTSDDRNRLPEGRIDVLRGHCTHPLVVSHRRRIVPRSQTVARRSEKVVWRVPEVAGSPFSAFGDPLGSSGSAQQPSGGPRQSSRDPGELSGDGLGFPVGPIGRCPGPGDSCLEGPAGVRHRPLSFGPYVVWPSVPHGERHARKPRDTEALDRTCKYRQRDSREAAVSVAGSDEAPEPVGQVIVHARVEPVRRRHRPLREGLQRGATAEAGAEQDEEADSREGPAVGGRRGPRNR